MKVYRYLTREELFYIQEGMVDKLGREWYEKRNKYNNHKYKKWVKYMHFFKSADSIKYYKQYLIMAKHDITNYCICEFDIPLIYLIGHKGKGEYYDLHGFDCSMHVEYAIDASKFQKEWLVAYYFDPEFEEINKTRYPYKTKEKFIIKKEMER